MINMTIEQLYDKLSDKDFQDTENGDLFYNYFLFQYSPEEEYEVERQITDFKSKLIRPLNFVDVLTIDLFEEFCRYLGGRPFGRNYPSLLKYLIKMESDNPEGVASSLTQKANSDEFFQYIHDKVDEYLSQEKQDDVEVYRPYIFLYGMGRMFPYLRTNVFLTKYEAYNETNRYKIIVFYPGHRENTTFRLFDRLNDSHTYRATLLINE